MHVLKFVHLISRIYGCLFVFRFSIVTYLIELSVRILKMYNCFMQK